MALPPLGSRQNRFWITDLSQVVLQNPTHAQDHPPFDRAIKLHMKTVNSLCRIATPPMTAAQIGIIQDKLLNLGIEGDEEAAQQYADLYLCRLNWEGTRSAQNRQDFVDHAQDAQAWLAVNSL